MAIRVGKVELVGLQGITTEDSQAMVELRGPGQAGGVFQDLGREPVTIVMEGLLFGAHSLAALEELREAQQQARPLPFAAEVISGAEMTDVLILDLRVQQLAGSRDHYSFFLRVREHNEPPESADAADAAVDAAVGAAADEWAAGAMDAAAVLEDPSTLADALADNPDLLGSLSEEELVDTLTAADATMDGDQLGGVLATLGERDPAALESALAGVEKRGGLGGFIDKLSAAGSAVRARLANVDLSKMLPLVMGLISGTGLIADVRKIIAAAQALRDELEKQDIKALLAELEGGDR